MKKYLLPIIALAMSTTFFSSCNKEAPDSTDTVLIDENASCFVPLELSYCLFDFEKDYLESTGKTKSSMASAIEKTTPSDLNYYLFRNGTLVGQKYISDITKFGVALPDKTQSYNLYLLANVGQKTLASATSESAMGAALKIDLGSQADFVSNCNEKGFPTAKKIEGFSASSSKSINLERLVHTLNVKIDKDALQALNEEGTSFTFTSLAVRQAAKDIYPFAAASKCTSTLAISGDTGLSSSDLERLNNGESVILYVAENMRGDCLPGVSDWKYKVPANFINLDDSQLATYIEIEAQAETPTATYNKVTYRAYLGTSSSNCDVKRNQVSTITNVFLNEMIQSEDWRIDKGFESLKPVDFSPNNCYDLICVKNWPLSVSVDTDIPGNRLYVECSDNKVNVQYDSSTKDILVQSDYDTNYIGYFGFEPLYDIVPIRVKSYDGLINETLNVKVQRSAFSVRWEYNNHSTRTEGFCELVLNGDYYTNEFMASKGLSFSITGNASLGGKTSWRNNSRETYDNSESFTVEKEIPSSASLSNTTFENSVFLSRYPYDKENTTDVQKKSTAYMGLLPVMANELLEKSEKADKRDSYWGTGNGKPHYAQDLVFRLYLTIYLKQNEQIIHDYSDECRNHSYYYYNERSQYTPLDNTYYFYWLWTNHYFPIHFTYDSAATDASFYDPIIRYRQENGGASSGAMGGVNASAVARNANPDINSQMTGSPAIFEYKDDESTQYTEKSCTPRIRFYSNVYRTGSNWAEVVATDVTGPMALWSWSEQSDYKNTWYEYKEEDPFCYLWP